MELANGTQQKITLTVQEEEVMTVLWDLYYIDTRLWDLKQLYSTINQSYFKDEEELSWVLQDLVRFHLCFFVKSNNIYYYGITQDGVKYKENNHQYSCFKALLIQFNNYKQSHIYYKYSPLDFYRTHRGTFSTLFTLQKCKHKMLSNDILGDKYHLFNAFFDLSHLINHIELQDNIKHYLIRSIEINHETYYYITHDGMDINEQLLKDWEAEYDKYQLSITPTLSFNEACMTAGVTIAMLPALLSMYNMIEYSNNITQSCNRISSTLAGMSTSLNLKIN